MDKEEIFKKLKLYHKSLRKPEYLYIESDNGVLTLSMDEKGLTANMQNNEASFEGWSIAIKAVIPEIAEKVVIKWAAKNIESENLHYVRFLYRLIRFIESYDWVSFECLDKKARNDYERIKDEISDWVVNYPSKGAKETAIHKEARLERLLNSILPGTHNQQLPVGLFFKEVSTYQERTPRRGSQIDLWSVEGNSFTVYELKKDDNRKVGIISELMFYANVIKDLSLDIIHYGTGAETSEERNFDSVYKVMSEKIISKVKGVFLTNNLHPLLNIEKKKLFEILNGNNREIEYQQMGFKVSEIYTIV